MYDGSLRTKSPWEALVTFQQMIVLANKHGELDMTADALSFRTGIPLEIIKTGIAALEQPDPDSRTPGEDGRRIVLLDPEGRNWGWRIVNYPIYRDMRNAEERREYMRVLMQERRAAKKRNGVTRDVTPRNVSDVNTPLAPVSNVSQGSRQRQIHKEDATTSPREAAGAFKLAPYLDAYFAVFPDSSPPASRFGKIFKRLEAKHGAPETLRRWRICLGAKGTFATPEELGAHWPGYEAAARTNGSKPSAGDQMVESMKRVFSGVKHD
jgi:hypothetical protein